MESVTRRSFLASGLVGTLGLALSPAARSLLAAPAPARRAKSCILVWLNGGPSHLDTFDPKPGTPTGGSFSAIDSAVPGLKLSEHLPKLAAQARHLAVVRSLTSKEADHDRAAYFLRTGNLRDDTVEYPALGAVVAKEWSAQDGDLPAFVAINGENPGAGFLGRDFAPFSVADVNAPVANVQLPEGVGEDRLRKRLAAVDRLDRSFAGRSDAARVAEQGRVTAKALRFRQSPALKAFDLSEEKPVTVAAYGIPVKPKEGEADGSFGKACLMARRLVEQGVRFVEVTLDGWDTHENNFATVAGLCKQLDPALAALTADLADRGLLGQTLVLCLGEFGRTPTVNPQNGRDHWSEAFSLVAAGGGVPGGRVVGATDEAGGAVKDRPVTVPDLYATLLALFGLDPARSYRTPAGRPIRLADKGKVVRELMG
jgi:hypothetical protein